LSSKQPSTPLSSPHTATKSKSTSTSKRMAPKKRKAEPQPEPSSEEVGVSRHSPCTCL
jgi:hypothetical protein